MVLDVWMSVLIFIVNVKVSNNKCTYILEFSVLLADKTKQLINHAEKL